MACLLPEPSPSPWCPTLRSHTRAWIFENASPGTRRGTMFEQVFVENSARTRRPLAVTLSFAGQVALIGLTVLAPLLRTEIIVPSRLMRIVTAPQNRGTPQRTPERTLATAPAHPATAPRLIFSSPVFREPGRVPDR